MRGAETGGHAGTYILKARLSALDGHVALHVLCAEAKSLIAAVMI